MLATGLIKIIQAMVTKKPGTRYGFAIRENPGPDQDAIFQLNVYYNQFLCQIVFFTALSSNSNWVWVRVEVRAGV